ncbi:MAG: hypothetical protein RLZZ310_312 [Pseudomonadota bacterium]
MPIWVLVLDYIMGMIMWTLIGRTAMNVFQREDSEFFFMFYYKTTSSIIRCLVFLYVQILFYALGVRILSDGNAFFSIRK